MRDARARPGTVSYGSPGQFSSPHITMIELVTKEKLTVNHVPFKGDADCLNSLMGNHVQLCAAGSSAGTLVDAGKLRWINLWTAQRSPRWPDAPTLRELGYDIVSNSPYGVAGPKGMDPKVVGILQDALRRAAEDPQHLAALKRQDQDLMYPGQRRLHPLCHAADRTGESAGGTAWASSPIDPIDPIDRSPAPRQAVAQRRFCACALLRATNPDTDR
ncbi:tripartite tricarboxylate transporter substrate-binding protein [Cupriavidus basilensis]